MNKVRVKRVLDWVIMIAFGATIGYLAFVLTTRYTQYGKGEKLYTQTQKEFTQETLKKDKVEESSTTPVASEQWYKKLYVDMENLQNVNSEIVAWLYFENEDISYPILHTTDNQKYLRTSYLGEELYSGSIFMETKNKVDFSDKHIILYGHNMKDLSMFGRLRFYREDSEYYKDHKYFQIITPNRYYRYQIISYNEVPATDKLYTVLRKNSEKVEAFVKDNILVGSNVFDTSSPYDNYVTLSTCTVGENRFVVNAVCIDTFTRIPH